MLRAKVRPRRTVVWPGTLALVLLAGCVAESPVSPLPIEAPSSAATSAPTVMPVLSAQTSAPESPTASPVTPRTQRPEAPSPTRTRQPTATTPTPSSCQGPVTHTIDVANDELALVPSLCVATGAILRIENIGPGEVRTDRPDLVDQRYEAGIVQIRLLRPGTVTVTIPQNGTGYDITVVVR